MKLRLQLLIGFLSLTLLVLFMGSYGIYSLTNPLDRRLSLITFAALLGDAEIFRKGFTIILNLVNQRDLGDFVSRVR